jgi:hypothetical protein
MLRKTVVSTVALVTLPLLTSGLCSIDILYELSSEWDYTQHFGRAVSSAGDIDGDGVAEVIVGIKYAYPNRVYLFSGLDGVLLDTLFSPGTGIRFGWSVDGLGDINGDSVSDVLVGAMRESPDSLPSYWNSGRAYAFSGISGQWEHMIESPHLEEGGQFGWVVRSVGDVDGDGIHDMGISSPWENPEPSPQEAGRAYLFSGGSGELIRELCSPNEEYQGFFGCSMAGLGDVDGDGIGDVAVGAYGEDGLDGLIDAGRVYVFSGASGGVLGVLVSPLAEWSGYFGWSIACVGDDDRDGIADLLIGAPWEDPGMAPGHSGRAYLFDVALGETILALSSPNPEVNGHFGHSLAQVTDLDDDGVGELIVGAPGEDAGGGHQNSGRAYVFSGQSGDLLETLASPNQERGGWFGYSVSGFQTKEKGSTPALIVGAPGEWDRRGRAYVFGAPTGIREAVSLIPPTLTLRVMEMPITTTQAVILLSVPEPGHVSVSVFRISGELGATLCDGHFEAGVHRLRWDGLLVDRRSAPSGVYICRARGNSGTVSARIVVVR